MLWGSSLPSIADTRVNTEAISDTVGPIPLSNNTVSLRDIHQLRKQWKTAAAFLSTSDSSPDQALSEIKTEFYQNSANYNPVKIAQLEAPVPEISAPEDRPRLRTEPLSPDEKPFIPTKVQVQKPSVGRSSPAVSIITPSAYGLPFRAIGVGAGFQARTRFRDSYDGGFGAGFGLGDPHKAVGLNIGIISFSSFRSSFFQRGTINFKVNRYLPHNVAIAAGINNGVTWGATDSSVSPYGVVTKQFILRQKVTDPLSRVYVSAGVGGGQFRPESDVIRGSNSVGAFGSVGLRVAEPVSFISEWSGQDLTLGLSISPFRKFPIVITPAVTDVTGTAGDGARFVVGIGYGFKF